MKGRFFCVMALGMFCSCGGQAAFPVRSEFGPAPVLKGRTSASAGGRLPLNRAGSLDYVFAAPPAIPENASLELAYSLEPGPSGFEGALILEAGGLSWELPPDPRVALSAEGGGGGLFPLEDAPDRDGVLRYAIPAPPGRLKGFRIVYDPGGKGQDGGVFEIRSVSLVERWFGAAAVSTVFQATPFVSLENGGLVIGPPEKFAVKGDLALDLDWYEPPRSMLVRGDVTLEASGEFQVPGVFLRSMPLRVSGQGQIKAARLRPGPSLPPSVPIEADPGLILAWPQKAWRDSRREIFRWDGFPEVLIFDTADYEVQDRFFKRLAFFVEKAGFRGRLAADEEIAGLHGWNAHDYSAASLARFFEAARAQAFALSPEERELEDLFLAEGLITRGAGGAIGVGEGAVISISRQSPGYLRRRFMVHEGFHGIFFIDPAFRAFARSRWNAFSRVGRRFLLSYFDFMAYDTADEDLMVNEFMAYLLQEPVSQAAAYFGETLPGQMLAVSPWREDALPAESEATPDGARRWPALERIFADEARAFSDYAAHRWGLAAGRVWKATVR